MHLILAQTPDPIAIKVWFEVAFWLAGGVAAVLGGLVAVKQLRAPDTQQTTIAAQPLEVREATTFATKPELHALEVRVTGEIQQLHGRISGVRKELGDKIDNLDDRIDAIPGRVISLLAETKAYHSGK